MQISDAKLSYAVKHDVAAEESSSLGSRLTGHGGADFFTMDSFVDAIAVSVTTCS